MNGILKALSDVMFPPTCVSCHTVVCNDAQPFCPSCFREIHFITSPLCSCCGMPFNHGGAMDHLCGECINHQPAFSMARSVGQYKAALLEAIHHFKYGGKTAIGESMGRMMAAHPFPAINVCDYSLIVPVPLHPKKLRERGFNQSAILARALSGQYAIRIDFLSLRRLHYTEPQVGLGSKERERNVRKAFAVDKPDKIKGERILLVDDVYTTGSTLKECARCLMDAGAERVAALTLARAF